MQKRSVQAKGPVRKGCLGTPALFIHRTPIRRRLAARLANRLRNVLPCKQRPIRSTSNFLWTFRASVFEFTPLDDFDEGGVAGLVDRQVQFPGSNYCFIFIFSILVIISLLSGFDIDIEKRDCALELKLN